MIAPSAHRHGFTDDELRHAFEHLIASEDLDEGMIMLVGPDDAGNMLEVGVVTSDDGGPIVVHAMKARTKYLR